ncbi:SusC/RagA family TonB-linked outer membrane protein [Mangrovimonas futianensis]|uniref:SusC/RagA family TonB-linked outer membrane protein n=1 Tax=Mangrovimonas futianensis TaxID=2895523 RepID=UPI001E326630|nr:TonB-dependent receptor [Mangrovimonas futianensis]MCF1420510.1 TonB-dependent receptor [Mangrovimonas futianensis]
MKHLKQFLIILFLLSPIIMVSQQIVKGTVTDKTNFPLPGASVLVKGTTKGEITDFDGKFSITLDETPATLVVSYLGYIAQEVTITSQTEITVKLEESSEQLDEVVIIGYGQVDKKDLTGSITSVKPIENAVAQSRNVEDLLQGRAAGVLVSANSSEPGATTSVKIRGTNSLTGNTEPLYVIDGIIMDSATEDVIDPLQGGNSSLSAQNGITGVNPRDIESIEVLKDASATAIYGSRGANGVIIITTKKGIKGEAKFNYAVTTRIGSVSKNIDVLESGDYVNYFNEVQAVNGNNPKFYVYPDGSIASWQTSDAYMLENSATIARLEGVDWADDIYKTSVSTSHRVTASGGGEKGDYYFGLGYNKNEGVVPNAFAKSIDFSMKLNNELSERLDMRTKISAFYGDYSASKGTEDLGGNNNNMVRQIITSAPFLSLGDNYYGTGDITENLDGPRAWITDYDDLSKEVRLLGSTVLNYKLSETFDYNLTVGADYRTKERKVWYGTAIFRGANVNGEAGIATLNRFRYNIDNTLRFKKRFNKNHRINGTVGTVIDQRFLQQIANTGYGFAIKDLRADGISNAEVTQPTVLYRENESLLSFLGRFNYTFKNRYLFTATYRADGSSRFAKGNKWGHFPALALAWKVNQESFLKKSESIDELKLRVGWGLTGNQAIPNYQFYTLMTGSNVPPYGDIGGGSVNGVLPAFLANPELTWETSSQYNAGFDLGLWDNRLTLTGDVFYKEVNDLLLNTQIGPSNGFNDYYVNQGTLINKGVEISFSADIIRNQNFTWNLYGNTSIIRNKIDDLGIPPDAWGTETYSAYLGGQISGGNHFKVPANIFIEGQAPGLFYGFETNGIISNEQDLENSPSFQGIAPQLGDVRLVDQNGDGNITDADRTIIGDPNPDFSFGLGSRFEYKGISLGFFFNGVYGNDIANGNLLREAYASGRNSDNIRSEAYFNAWSETNPTGTYPRVGYDLETTSGFTDRIVEDGSFLRLNYVTLGYDLPVEGIDFLDSAYVSVSGQNLWLLTDYSGYDPEVNSFSYDPTRIGVDWNSFPNQKSYSVSLNITF